MKHFCLQKEVISISRNIIRENRRITYYIFQKKKIGLEVTALVRAELATIRTAQNKCLQKATELAKQKGLPIVAVKVEFRSDRAPIDIDEAAKELVEFVEKKIPEINKKKSSHYCESGLKYIKWIIIQLGIVNGRQWLPDYRFEQIPMNWMRINPIGEIQARIDEKQLKIPSYRKKCDKCWLLIGVNEWAAPEAVKITEELKNHVFSGDFKRLFFLSNIEGIVTELKISNK